MKTIRGVIESKRTEKVTSKKTGKNYIKTFLKIAGVEYGKFGNTVDNEGEEVTLEFEESQWGNDIQAITNHTQYGTAPSKPRAGPAEKKSNARSDKAIEQFTLDMQRMNARLKALDIVAASRSDKGFGLEHEKLLEIAEKIENWIMRETPQLHGGGSLEIMSDLIINTVQTDKNGKVSYEKIDKLFICDPKTREAAYKKAQESGQVELLNGFWFDKARSG